MDSYWHDLFFFVGEGRAEAFHALSRMSTPDFFLLLEAHRRNHKPA